MTEHPFSSCNGRNDRTWKWCHIHCIKQSALVFSDEVLHVCIDRHSFTGCKSLDDVFYAFRYNEIDAGQLLWCGHRQCSVWRFRCVKPLLLNRPKITSYPGYALRISAAPSTFSFSEKYTGASTGLTWYLHSPANVLLFWLSIAITSISVEVDGNNSDVDAVTSASVVAPGNTARLAQWIQEYVGGDLFPMLWFVFFDFEQSAISVFEEYIAMMGFWIFEAAKCYKLFIWLVFCAESQNLFRYCWRCRILVGNLVDVTQ